MADTSLDNKLVTVTSYNSRGFSEQKQNYMETLLLFSDIFCGQEHFLLSSCDKKHSNTNKLIKAFGNSHDMYIVPAKKQTGNVNKGRGSGGLVTMFRKYLTKYVSQVKCENYRLQGTKFLFPSCSLLVVNCYLPCDSQNNNADHDELISCLEDIKILVEKSECSNILLCGDWNTDFGRNSTHVRIVNHFVEEIGATVFWSNPDNDLNHLVQNVDFTHTTERQNVMFTSTVDHFISSKTVYDCAREAGVIHSADNFSDHCPIYTKLEIEELDITIEKQAERIVPKWNKATDEDKERYRNSLSGLLNGIQLADGITCLDVRCKCENHNNDLEGYCVDVLDCIETSAQENIPLSGGGTDKKERRKNLAGWNEFVKPYQDESKFWHGVWAAAGKPTNGDLYTTMKQSKMQYKYEVRKLKKSQDRIKSDKLGQSVMDGSMFEHIKKSRKKKQTCSSRIDGEVGSENIAQHFADLYGQLFSRVQLGQEFEELREDLENQIAPDSLIDVFRVDDDVVKLALGKMKSGKSDGQYSFNSDCLINGPPELIRSIVNMFRSFLIHGRVPRFLLLCTLVPIVKDNFGDIASSDNYRAIAIGSLIMKLFDWVMLLLESDKLTTDELQFGYEKMSSSVMCSWGVSAVVDYFNRQGRAVYACAMDLSKAFDMVEWVSLFAEMVKRKVSIIFLRVLLYIYSEQTCNVRWNGKVSDKFNVSNGVRQGMQSSGLCFNLVVNFLSDRLRRIDVGLKMPGGYYVGIWIYCDDIYILCGSRLGLQSMVTECEKFAAEYNMKFSTNVEAHKSKTKATIFTKDARDLVGVDRVVLNNNKLPWVDEIKHVGNLMEIDNSFTHDIQVKRGAFIGRIHSLNQEFYYASGEVKTRLYDIFSVRFMEVRCGTFLAMKLLGYIDPTMSLYGWLSMCPGRQGHFS